MIAIQVTVKVSADVARALHRRGPPAAEAEELSSMVQALGVTLEPMHPGTEDPNLMSYFTVKVPDPETAQSLIARLQESEAVEAAYVQPPVGLP